MPNKAIVWPYCGRAPLVVESVRYSSFYFGPLAKLSGCPGQHMNVMRRKYLQCIEYSTADKNKDAMSEHPSGLIIQGIG